MSRFLTIPCPNVSLDCPRCGGDGFYEIDTDPLNVPGTEGYRQQPTTPIFDERRQSSWLRAWMTACLVGLVVFIVALFLYAIAAPRPEPNEAPPSESRYLPVDGLASAQLGAPSERVDGATIAVPTRHDLGAPLPAAASTEPLSGWATVDEGQGHGHAAAGPALRKLLGGDPAFRGDVVTVTSEHGSVTVRLTDSCWCKPRHGKPTIIDLDETDFRTLTGRGPGVEWVVISSATSSIALPATDTAP